MFRSFLTVVVFSLVCVFTSSQPTCDGIYNPIEGPPFTSLNTSVYNEFVDLLIADLETTNNTINVNEPAATTCLASIDTKQTECVKCINTTCQARVDFLKCTAVAPQTSSSGSCALGKAICDMTAVVAKAGQGVAKAGIAIKDFVNKAVVDIKKFAEVAVKTIGSGLESAGQSIKNVAEKTASGIAKTAENIVSEVGKAAENVGKTIANELEKAAEKVVKGLEDGAKAIVKIADKIVGRKRREVPTEEPTCATFQNNNDSCLYYHSQCASCSVFGLGDATEPTVSQLISGVCSQADLDSYNLLSLAIERIDDIIEAYANFTSIYTAKFIGSSYVHPAGYQCVQVDFGMTIENITLDTSPNNPYNYIDAGKIIANDIFNRVLP